MNIQDIYQLMERFEGSSMTELNLEMEGTKVVLKRGGEPMLVQPVSVAHANEVTEKMDAEKALKANSEVLGTAVEAPLVGTFYAAPSPEEAPFVSVGSKVKKGDVVGIIEAMKLMNEIIAPCDGTIEAIEVENGQMVEFHQVLMRINQVRNHV